MTSAAQQTVGVIPPIAAPLPNERRVTPRTATPAYVLDVSRPVNPRRWTTILLAPIELLALAWGAGLVILLIMAPIGIAVASALWLSRVILGWF